MAKNLIEKITEKQINPNVPEFRVGDEVIVGCKITEESASNFVKVAQFDNNFVSEDKQLKLNISDDIVIVNEKGERTSKDEVIKQNTIVFYGSTTKSIPAQTTPYKLIVFPKTENPYVEENPETTETIDTTKLDALIGKDFYIVKGKKMVPLRKVAEGLGYHVEATTKGVIISKGAPSYTITRGEKTYGYNKSLRQFEVALAIFRVK